MAYQRGTTASYQKWADEVGDESYTFERLLPFCCSYRGGYRRTDGGRVASSLVKLHRQVTSTKILIDVVTDCIRDACFG